MAILARSGLGYTWGGGKMDSALFAAIVRFSPDPIAIVGLLALLLVYLRGSRILARYGGFERQIGSARMTAFWIGWLSLAVALLSPIATGSAYLLSLHMVQHLLLIQIGVPLILMARPVPTMILGLPRALSRLIMPHVGRNDWLYRLGSALTQPWVATPVFLAVFLVWHQPALYDLADSVPIVHYLEHVTFLGSAVLFWWAAIDPLSGRARRRRYLSLISQGVAFFVANGLGIYLSFAKATVYRAYAAASQQFGFSALDDQLVAGLIMWIVGGLLFSVSTLWTLAAAANEEELAHRRRELLATET